MKKSLLFILSVILSFSAPAGFVQAADSLEDKAVAEVSKASDSADTEKLLGEASIKEDSATQEAASELVKELGKPVEEAAKVVSAVWQENPPLVKVSPFGTEIKINVNFDPKMGKEKVAAIQSVKLETEKGEFLGLKTYGPEETSREAEFMVNPEALKIDKVKVTMVSSADGEYSTTASLIIPTEEPKKEEAAPAAEVAKVESAAAAPAKEVSKEVSAAKSKGKKKGWF